MEYFSGTTLDDYVSLHGNLNLTDFVAIFYQIAVALHAAHSSKRPIIHRDLKPANVMVRNSNGNWQVKVIDFGLAVHSEILTSSLHITHENLTVCGKSIAGTIKYAAPEQVGEKPYKIGPHSDVFSFGKTAMYCLFNTTEPKERHWNTVHINTRAGVKRVIERCAEEDLGPDLRLASFVPLVAAFAQAMTSVNRAKTKSSDQDGFEELLKQLASEDPIASAPPIQQRTRKRAKVARTRTRQANRIFVVENIAVPIGKFAGDKFDLELPNGVQIPFVWCPRGSFEMGSKEIGIASETLHRVKFSEGFFIGASPVTQLQWKAVMSDKWKRLQNDFQPITDVTWFDAVEFCAKLTESTIYSLRLPTEAEWEYACRAGTVTEYHFGDIPNTSKFNYDGNEVWNGSEVGEFRTQPTDVGTFDPNAWGLYDYHGNVGEWCEDWSEADFYTRSPSTDPVCLDGEKRYRTIRSGGWNSDPSSCASSFRSYMKPNCSYNSIGFRLRIGLKTQLIHRQLPAKPIGTLQDYGPFPADTFPCPNCNADAIAVFDATFECKFCGIVSEAFW